ncbi:DUF1501 domain-containing protein [Rubritalea spongiae]|uniref:DUF1501 domain-containing protein n=1 Tax=Rubritalea spongiae TaxID=430797 RepID=A0ABW5E138_9BACT
MKNSFFNKTVSRRSFLQDCGKMTSIGALSSIISLKMVNQVFAARPSGSITDYKGLVCIFFHGGNDSFNMLTPGLGSAWDNYVATRGNLALPQAEMHRIVDSVSGQDYHVHRRMEGVKNLFDDGDLSFVANVGTLVEPTTLSQMQNSSVKLPYGLYSHNDQQKQWQTSISDTRSGSVTGWGGRMLEILNDAANNNATAAVNLSPSGSNLFQDSGSSIPFSIKGGVNSLDLYKSNSSIKDAVDSDLEKAYSTVLQNHHEHVRARSIEQTELLETIADNTDIATPFPNTYLGKQLRQVAIYIKAQGVDGLNANRQTFFCSQGGFDLHGEGLDAHNNLLQSVSDALVAFNAALKEIGYHDKVVTYTASDFGRSLTTNGGGTDHGWGGNQIVMGGPVSGGQVFGDYPTLALGTMTDTGRGRQLPTTSVDELHASLAYWYGIENNNEMELVVPNIRNFWTSGSTQTPIAGMFG